MKRKRMFVCRYMARSGECYFNTLLCCDYFSSSSVLSRAFSALCVYSKFGHHPHSLGYLCAKFSFFCTSIAQLAHGEKSPTHITQLIWCPRNGSACASENVSWYYLLSTRLCLNLSDIYVNLKATQLLFESTAAVQIDAFWCKNISTVKICYQASSNLVPIFRPSVGRRNLIKDRLIKIISRSSSKANTLLTIKLQKQYESLESQPSLKRQRNTSAMTNADISHYKSLNMWSDGANTGQIVRLQWMSGNTMELQYTPGGGTSMPLSGCSVMSRVWEINGKTLGPKLGLLRYNQITKKHSTECKLPQRWKNSF